MESEMRPYFTEEELTVYMRRFTEAGFKVDYRPETKGVIIYGKGMGESFHNQSGLPEAMVLKLREEIAEKLEMMLAGTWLARKAQIEIEKIARYKAAGVEGY